MLRLAEHQTRDFDLFSIDYKILYGVNDRLIVHFHGAINKTRVSLPFFKSMQPHCSSFQITIADPTIASFDSIPASWYLGWEGSELTERIQELIAEVSAAHGLKHRIYVGGSSGGFAALHHAALDPGSIALVYNPQTNLETHAYPRAAQLFLQECWPNIKPVLNVQPFFSQPRDVSVIYLQSPGDGLHVHDQAAPFLAAIHPENRDRFIYLAPYEGVMGHGKSLTLRSTVGPWVQLVDRAPEWSAERLLETYYSELERPISHEQPQKEKEKSADRDLELASRVRDILLPTPQ